MYSKLNIKFYLFIVIVFLLYSDLNEHRKGPNRRRSLLSAQVELSCQNIHPLSHSSITTNLLALALLKKLNTEPTSVSSWSLLLLYANQRVIKLLKHLHVFPSVQNVVHY